MSRKGGPVSELESGSGDDKMTKEKRQGDETAPSPLGVRENKDEEEKGRVFPELFPAIRHGRQQWSENSPSIFSIISILSASTDHLIKLD